MSTVGKIVVAVLVIAVVYQFITAVRERRKYHFVRYLDNLYMVLKQDNDHDAAQMIAKVSDDITTLLAYLKKRYPDNRVTRSVLANWNPDAFGEITPDNAFGYTSYTVDRGKYMRLCLREKRTMKLHDANDMIFVTLHELTHVANWEAEHGDAFWADFKFILRAAVECGIYRATDYSKQPIVYCGLPVAYNPLFDRTLAT